MNKIALIKFSISKKCLLLFFILLSSKLYSQSLETHIDTLKEEDGYVIRKDIGIFGKNERLIESYQLFQMYYLNWNLKGSYTIPEGLFIKYYEDGNIMEIEKTIKGRKIGLYLFLYSNGVIKIIGNYKDIECYSDITNECDTSIYFNDITKETAEVLIKYIKSIKTGKWIYYNEKGDIIKEDFFQ